MRKLTEQELRRSRWLRALQIAKILFSDEGYHTDYLEEIEQHIKTNGVQELTDAKANS